jgi:hypothetical protein
MKIRRNDGNIADVEPDYVLANGESIIVPLRFRDEADPDIQRAIAATTDAMRQEADAEAALHRPGFRFGDAAASARAHAAREEYVDHVRGAWRGQPRPRTERRERERQREAPDPRDERALRDAADVAQQQYLDRITSAWRTPLTF